MFACSMTVAPLNVQAWLLVLKKRTGVPQLFKHGMLMRAGEDDVLWERTFPFVGRELEPSGHSGAALAHRIVKANGVFSAWRPILLNPNIPLRARAAFGISVASSLLWQAGNWTLTESELSRLGSWGARKLFCHVVQEAEPEPLHW